VSKPDITPRDDEWDDDWDDERDDEPALRDPLLDGARVGVCVHGAITAVVCVVIVVLNVTRAPELIWWPLPVLGMLLGLGVHWWYGYDRLEEQLRRRQEPADDLPGAADRPGAPGTTS
jgi:hypothetical protein